MNRSVPEGMTLRTDDADQTRAVGAALAPHLRAGDVLALSGELGAGKTCLVQGLAAGLDVDARVVSPTFMLVRTYAGRLPLVHADVYRLDRLQEVWDLGDEVFAPDAVTVVEWGDAIAGALPADHLEVEIVHVDGADPARTDRRLALRPHGGWSQRLADVAGGVDRWLAPSDEG